MRLGGIPLIVLKGSRQSMLHQSGKANLRWVVSSWDLDRSIEFYASKLEMELLDRRKIPETRRETAELKILMAAKRFSRVRTGKNNLVSTNGSDSGRSPACAFLRCENGN